jgi:GDP-mannose 4,6-dehydratase
MTNLITGIGGFVASHLAKLLNDKKECVFGTYRWNEDLWRVDSLEVNLIPADLTDLSSMIKALEIAKPDYIFHLAAQSYVQDSFTNPTATMNANIIGTLNLLEAIRFTNLDPIVHLCSSSEVYGNVTSEEVPVKETHPLCPINPYAVSKAACDLLGYQYFNSYGMKIIRTRMFTHTGPGRTMMSAEASFSKQIARIELGLQEPIIKVGNLDSVRTFADVRDAVTAYYELVRKCKYGEAYNIGGNRTMTIGEMLNYLLSLSSIKNIKIQIDPRLLRPSDVTLQIPDISKFTKCTGWQPTISFEQTMLDLLNWWRQKIKDHIP